MARLRPAPSARRRRSAARGSADQAIGPDSQVTLACGAHSRYPFEAGHFDFRSNACRTGRAPPTSQTIEIKKPLPRPCPRGARPARYRHRQGRCIKLIHILAAVFAPGCARVWAETFNEPCQIFRTRCRGRDRTTDTAIFSRMFYPPGSMGASSPGSLRQGYVPYLQQFELSMRHWSQLFSRVAVTHDRHPVPRLNAKLSDETQWP